MPELIIKYKNKKALEALMDFSKYFDFSVVVPSQALKEETLTINGVTVIPADNTIDTSALEAIFSNRNIDAKKLRRDLWQRTG